MVPRERADRPAAADRGRGLRGGHRGAPARPPGRGPHPLPARLRAWPAPGTRRACPWPPCSWAWTAPSSTAANVTSLAFCRRRVEELAAAGPRPPMRPAPPAESVPLSEVGGAAGLAAGAPREGAARAGRLLRAARCARSARCRTCWRWPRGRTGATCAPSCARSTTTSRRRCCRRLRASELRGVPGRRPRRAIERHRGQGGRRRPGRRHGPLHPAARPREARPAPGQPRLIAVAISGAAAVYWRDGRAELLLLQGQEAVLDDGALRSPMTSRARSASISSRRSRPAR